LPERSALFSAASSVSTAVMPFGKVTLGTLMNASSPATNMSFFGFVPVGSASCRVIWTPASSNSLCLAIPVGAFM
jgi:hypothetical protein